VRLAGAAALAALVAFSVAEASRTEGEPGPRSGEPVMLELDPAVLGELEARGYGFGAAAFDAAGSTAAELFGASPGYRSIVGRIGADVARHRRGDRHAGVGMRHAHRLFDPAWLRSSEVRFDLIAVVNRLDRRLFEEGTCGETRLVYRMSYAGVVEGEAVSSRLPLTFNVVFWQDAEGGDCREVARRWVLEPGAESRAASLVRGPLSWERLRARQKSVEVNFQIVRWPSTVRPAFAGHAEYRLRVFRRRAGRATYAPAPLENTPDLAKIERSPALRAELLAWVRAHLPEIDRGVATMPERFLAREATSIAPGGMERAGNRPFLALFGGEDLEGLPFGAGGHVQDGDDLLRRLDGMSCQGCHQSRSLAGFHLLGHEADASRRLDAIAVPGSSHLHGELHRRTRDALALLAGEAPEGVGPSVDAEGTPGGYGSACRGDGGLECAPGLHCEADAGRRYGVCLPDEASLGDPCEPATIERRGRRETATVGSRACGAAAGCFTNEGGFPGGVCVSSCARAGEHEACGMIPVLGPFNSCIARGQPFPRCLRETTDPVALRACDEANACRDDYVCAKGLRGANLCVPPYFLFQLRVDGHRVGR
jgi:hypothetical protein